MSVPTPQPPSQPVAISSNPPGTRKREILIIQHSTLFYWWPVWAIGFLLGCITLIGGHAMAVVPSGTSMKVIPTPAELKKKDDGKDVEREALVLPADGKVQRDRDNVPERPHLSMTANKNLGVLFTVVLLLVITITNIPLRGLWSVIVIVTIFSLVIIFALLEWWTIILHHLSFLDIRINAAGYMVISGVLLILWLVVVILFDQQIYMVFTPGQLRVRQEIGDAETAYDTTGMTIQKQRSDLFRHWILGIGSGDLIVKTAGANPQEFHMNNVLFVGRKVKEIEEMLRSRQVVSGQPS